MTNTKEWAESLNIDTQDILPPSEDIIESYCRTASEVAVRTIILHSIVAVASGIDRERVTGWLQDQNLWEQISPRERSLLQSPRRFKEDRSGAQWLQEAQWALLWTIQRVKGLGLPTKTCNSVKLVDEIMPVLGGDDIDQFISSAEFRPASEISAESDRTGRLYYYARQAADKEEMPEDLIYSVLYNRYYAFRWLISYDSWDDVDMGIDDLNFD
ncbi:MAG: DUF4272 domain-containing protein [Desulfobacteraceae bacterium]|jgi:hypothetical protein